MLMILRLVSLLLVLTSGCSSVGRKLAEVQEPDQRMRILTLNTWFLPRVLVKHTDERLKRFASVVSELKADVIFLQEVWTSEAQTYIASALRRVGYPYCVTGSPKGEVKLYADHFPLRGVLGNGLMICARHALAEPEVLQFTDFSRADEYMVHKGALRSTTEIPGLGKVDLFNAHLGARSFDVEARAFNREHTRVIENQGREFVGFVSLRKQTPLQIIGADFNVPPYVWDARKREYDNSAPTFLWKFMLQTMKWRDPLSEFDPLISKQPTWDTRLNTYVRDASEAGPFAGLPSERVDAILLAGQNQSLRAVGGGVAFRKPVGFDDDMNAIQLSDHFGAWVDLEIVDVLEPQVFPEKTR